MTAQLGKRLLDLAGEFSVASQLCLRGFLANLTLKNYPNVDLFVYNPRTGKTTTIQVKTTLQKNLSPAHEAYPFIITRANHESLDDKLNEEIKSTHIFVYVLTDRSSVKFFIVPPEDVKSLAKKTLERWLAGSKHRKTLVELKKREQVVALALVDLEPYEDRWDLLERIL